MVSGDALVRGRAEYSSVRMSSLAPCHGHDHLQASVDFDPSDLIGREFVCLDEVQKLRRRLILQSSGPMPHMTPNESVTLSSQARASALRPQLPRVPVVVPARPDGRD